MATYPITSISERSLPPHCSPTTPLLIGLSEYLQTCLPTTLALVSTLLGSLSIISWLFAQMPQIYKNYQIKSTAGLSIFFLGEWLAGDITNLLGALFTKQATWQVIIASYYVFVDMCLVIQYFWYTYFTRKIYGESLHSSNSSEREGDSDSINALSPVNSNYAAERGIYRDEEDNSLMSTDVRAIDAPRFSSVSYEKSRSPQQSAPRYSDKFGLGTSWMPSPSPRTFMLAATLTSMAGKATAAPVPFPSDHYQHLIRLLHIETPLEFIGTILSWCSTLLYLGSRLPQLYKNWTRKSTAGLSPLLFFAAFCGNMFYSTSMLTNPKAWYDLDSYGGHGWADQDGSSRGEWLARAAPFFLGAAGVLALDAMMGIQFMLYGEREVAVVKVRDGHGHSKWQKVNGWMRGWIPIIAKERVVDLAESQRLLNQEQTTSMSFVRSREYGTPTDETFA